MTRLARYLLPHLFGVVAGTSFFFAVRWFTALGGACRFFCYPPVTLTMGVLAGLIGGQLYRADHPA